MRTKRRASVPSVSVYVLASEDQVKVDSDSMGRCRVNGIGDWSAISRSLSAADAGVVTVLFGDLAQNCDVRWIGLLCAVENEGNKTEIQVAFLAEQPFSIPVTELRYFTSGERVKSLPENVPFICLSPRFHSHPAMVFPDVLELF